MSLIPYRVDVPFNHTPYTNVALLIACIAAFFFQISAPGEAVSGWVLEGWGIKGLIGHMWLHADIFHLAGNMIFLWVFGNAVCSKVGNLWYFPLYLLFGIFAGLTFLIFTPGAAVGASGAIFGVVGMYLVFFSRNTISCAWILFFPYFRIINVASYWIVLLYVAFDVLRLVVGSEGVAYMAHLGGFASGFAAGIIMLKTGVIEMERDEQSLLDILQGKHKKTSTQSATARWAQVTGQSFTKPAYEPEPSSVSVETQPAPPPKPAAPVLNTDDFMYIRFKCPCGQKIKVPMKYAGKTGKCPGCKKPVKIPDQ